MHSNPRLGNCQNLPKMRKEPGANSPANAASRGDTYVPIDVIGRGSFGVVIHARVAETGEDVAIKRVLFDRRLHNRELFLMRDILHDARLPAPADAAVASSENMSSVIAAESPQSSPLSQHTCRSASIPASSGSTRSKRAPVVLLRKHPNVVRLRNHYFSTDPENGERFLHLVMSYLPTDLQIVKRSYFKNLGDLFQHQSPSATNEDEEGVNNFANKNASVEDPKTALFPLIFSKVILFQLCRALAFLHARHVCHRDVKPGNILIDPQTARLQLCDFGSAKQIHNRNEEKNVSYICSRYYRAPELLFGALHYGPEVDMWSTGCIAAEFLRSAGTPVFKGATTVDQMAEIFKVLGAPSDAEMYAMNPQSAQAMRMMHQQLYPSTTAASPSATAGTAIPFSPHAPAYTSDGTESNTVRHGTATAHASASSGTHSAYSSSPSASPTFNRDYYDCYDVLRIEALQWKRVLHRDVPEEAVDFVAKLLCYVPEKRLSAAAALEHPFFDDLFSTHSHQPDEAYGSTCDEEARAGGVDALPLPRLPNGKTLPVEMFMLTEIETELYSAEFQRRMNGEVQRISSATAASTQPNSQSADSEDML